MFSFLVLSIAIMTGYQGQLLLKRGPAERTYAGMLLANMGLAIVSYAAWPDPDESSRGSLAELLGAVAVGGFVCLVMVPPFLRELARRAFARDRLDLAARILALRELLQPGLTSRQERQFAQTMAAIRTGKVEDVLSRMQAERLRIDDPAERRALDERVILTELYARRYDDAITYFERTIDRQGPISVHLLVELVRAYGETGDLEKAALLMQRIEAFPEATEPLAQVLIMRARMVFLAFLGRAQDVETMLSPSGPLALLPAPARSYWIGIARFYAGDRESARRALNESISGAADDNRARQIARATLADFAVREPGPRVMSAATADVADRIVQALIGQASQPRAQSVPLPQLRGPLRRLAPVTAALLAINVLVAFVVSSLVGSTQDSIVLALAGANVKPAVRAGEWWRLYASTFLHAGSLHLLTNMYGLWVLGKLVEQILGSRRFFAVYSLAGIAGAGASLLFGGEGISVGASGAVLGILGAAICELAASRLPYPEALRKALLGNLVFVAAAQFLVGMAEPMIDQSAHLGGFITGGLLTFLVSPRARFAKRQAVRALALALFIMSLGSGAYVLSAVGARYLGDGWQRRDLGAFSLDVPATWQLVGSGTFLAPEYGRVNTLVADGAREIPGVSLETIAEAEAMKNEVHLRQEETVKEVQAVSPPLETKSPGWTTREFRLTLTLAERTEVYHNVILMRLEGGNVVRLAFLVPESKRENLRSQLPRLLASLRLEH